MDFFFLLLTFTMTLMTRQNWKSFSSSSTDNIASEEKISWLDDAEKSKMFFKDQPKKIISLKRRKKMRIVKSENLLVEDLHNSRQLETVFYATELEQMTDFVWFRDSGIRVNVALFNVNIVALYSDVQHETSDNDFVMEHLEYLRPSFRVATEKFCRHPVPDFYNMTLEIFKDRETKARMELNDEAEGQPTLRRKVNEACHQRTPQVVLQGGSNVMLCTQENPLLTDIFGIEPSPQVASPSRPSLKNCADDWNRCSACERNAHKCPVVLDRAEQELERSCCMITCLSRASCRSHYSSSSHLCSLESQVDCARGDAYRFSLLPIFERPSEELNCHLERKLPATLYSLSYHLSLPSSIETPRVKHRVPWSAADRHAKTLHRLDFLNVEFEPSSCRHDEMILTVRRSSPSGEIEYLTKPFLSPSTLRGPSVHPHETLRDSYRTSVLFHPPFSYSTSAWSSRHEDCRRNLSRFSGVRRAESLPSVNVIQSSRKAGSSFEYLIGELDKSPHLRLYLPGSSSVLRSCFAGMNYGLLWFDSSVLLVDQRHATIKLRGEVGHCPSYLMLVGSDLTEQEELFRLDLLVSCPVIFDLAIHNLTLSATQNDREKLLELTLDDIHAEHSTLHTIVTKSRYFKGNADNATAVDSVNDHARDSSLHNFGIVFVVLTAALIFLVCCFSLALLGGFRKGSNIQGSREKSFPRRNIHGPPQHRSSSPPQKGAQRAIFGEDDGKFKKEFRFPLVLCFKMFFACFIVTKVVYNVLFTFTVITLLLFAWINENIDGERDTRCLRLWNSNDLWKVFETFGFCLETSVAFQKRLESCDDYMDAVVSFLAKEVHKHSTSTTSERIIYTGDSFNLVKSVSDKLSEWRMMQARSHERYASILNNSIRKIATNRWFVYPKLLKSKIEEYKQKTEWHSSLNLKIYFESIGKIFMQTQSGDGSLAMVGLPSLDGVRNVSCMLGSTGSHLTLPSLSKYFASNEHFRQKKSSLSKVTQSDDKPALCPDESNEGDDSLLQLQSLFIFLLIFSDILLLVQRFSNLVMFSKNGKVILIGIESRASIGRNRAPSESSRNRDLISQKHSHSVETSSSTFSLESSYLTIRHLKPTKHSAAIHKNFFDMPSRKRTASKNFLIRGFWSFSIMTSIVIVKDFLASLTHLSQRVTPRLESLVAATNLCFSFVKPPSILHDLKELKALCQFSARKSNLSSSDRQNCNLQIYPCFDESLPQTAVADIPVPGDFYSNDIEGLSASISSILDAITCIIIFFVLSTAFAAGAQLSFRSITRTMESTPNHDKGVDALLHGATTDGACSGETQRTGTPSPESCVDNRERHVIEKRRQSDKHRKFSETKV